MPHLFFRLAYVSCVVAFYVFSFFVAVAFSVVLLLCMFYFFFCDGTAHLDCYILHLRSFGLFCFVLDYVVGDVWLLYLSLCIFFVCFVISLLCACAMSLYIVSLVEFDHYVRLLISVIRRHPISRM